MNLVLKLSSGNNSVDDSVATREEELELQPSALTKDLGIGDVATSGLRRVDVAQ